MKVFIKKHITLFLISLIILIKAFEYLVDHFFGNGGVKLTNLASHFISIRFFLLAAVLYYLIKFLNVYLVKLDALLRKYNYDGRYILLLLLLLYYSNIPISYFFFGDYDFIMEKWLRIPVLRDAFFDLRVMTSGLDCYRLGIDPLLKGPCASLMGIPYAWNYPRTWYLLAFTGLGEKHTVFLAIIFILLFFCSIFIFVKKLNFRESILYALILCSFPVTDIVEKCNIDIIIFLLFSVIIIFLTRKPIFKFLSYLIILLAATLKLYPVSAITYSLREKPKNFLICNIIVIILFSIYLFITRRDLAYVYKLTPKKTAFSNGAFVYMDFLNQTFSTNYPKYHNFVATFFEYRHLFALSIVGFISIICFVIFQKQRNSEMSIDDNIDAFRIGASVYLGTFLLGNNFDHRLIFLIFTIPQILFWINNNNQLSKISRLTLVGIIYAFYYNLLFDHFDNFFLFSFKELVNWYLFTYFFYALLITMPNWAKSFVGLNESVKGYTNSKTDI